MKGILLKLIEVFLSISPIVLLVVILHLTIAPLATSLLIRFLIGTVFVVIGLTLFLLGVQLGIEPLGGLTGISLAKTNRLWMVLLIGVILGFFISIAEPGLMVLSNQVNEVTGGAISGISMLIAVSLGLAIMLALGFLRIFYNIPLYIILMVLYGIIFTMAIFSSREFFAIAFDASGSTTGILAVPFILSLSVGLSRLKKDSKASEKDSFGLVAIASTGAIMAVLLLGLLSNPGEMVATLSQNNNEIGTIGEAFLSIMPRYGKESILAIAPLLAIFLIMKKIAFKLSKRETRKLLTGFGFALLGLFVFLIGINAGFMDVGERIGSALAMRESKVPIILVGFVMGVVTMLAEPAVYVLTNQIEEVTSGSVKRRTVLIPLAVGVGIAIALSVIRILVPEIMLWYYLVPGYGLCILLMFFIPKLFIGIAFDAGGVATGPITATFIFAFVQGAANTSVDADLIADGFGMIAMVAMLPIITLEILGLIYGIKSRTKGVKK